MEPFDYQKVGIDFLKIRKSALLADEPGLGKTGQAIMAAKEVGAVNILVICPKSPIANWMREFAMWWPEREGTGRLTVVNFDLFSQKPLKHKVKEIIAESWDVVLIDEAHRLKTPGANRTKAIYGKVIKNAKRVWLLSGTPTPNHNGELWSHLRATAPSNIKNALGEPMSKTEFEDEYCKVDDHPQFGRRIIGNKNTKALKERIAPWVLRRRKAEVLPDMPALRFSNYPILGASTPLGTDLPPNLSAENGEDVLAWLRSEEVPLSSERRLTGAAKAPGVIDVVNDALNDGQPKVIVFAHHRDVLDLLEQGLANYNTVRIDGQVSADDRDTAVTRFQTDDSVRVFLGQISACGEALTLTAASEVIFAEFSWTPSENYQAACRAHRIGQNNAVNARFISVAGSIDDVIAKTLARKAREISELFG
tara:strand:+ start:12373 stop:13638 length:1266 start_codon:yes stop_codon:yes gene_type:complete